MKSSKNLVLIFIFLLPILLNAQSKKKIKKNEIGTDVTALIEQILNFNQSEFNSPYRATYHLTYKRHFKKFSGRFGIGGNTSSRESDDSYPEEIVKRSYQQINYRIGIEKPIEINSRWEIYLGLDFRHFISNSQNDFNYQNGGWIYGSDVKGSTLGVVPVFGINFKISERVFLQTEANFIAYWSKTKNQPKITQISDNPSFEMPSTDLEIDKIKGTAFNVPNFLVLTIKL